MVLPVTPEEYQELRHRRTRWLRWAGGVVVLSGVVALGVVVLRSDGDPTAEAATTAATVADGPASPTVLAPADVDPAAVDPSTTEPLATVEAVTVRGDGADAVDLTEQFVEGHVVVRYAVSGSGLIILTDRSGTVLDGGSIVVDDSSAASGAVIVPRLPAAALASVDVEGAWELTALDAGDLPVLTPGAIVESSGNAALRPGDAAGLEVRVVGDCAEPSVLVELWDDTSLLSAVELDGGGSVPMLRATRYVSVRSGCTWSMAA
ncbi:MAG: hypothetical protein AAGF02_13125 [Actinomycetota bacterium]